MSVSVCRCPALKSSVTQRGVTVNVTDDRNSYSWSFWPIIKQQVIYDGFNPSSHFLVNTRNPFLAFGHSTGYRNASKCVRCVHLLQVRQKPWLWPADSSQKKESEGGKFETKITHRDRQRDRQLTAHGNNHDVHAGRDHLAGTFSAALSTEPRGMCLVLCRKAPPWLLPTLPFWRHLSMVAIITLL